MRHSIEKIKKKLVCLLAVVFTVHHLSGYGFAEEAVSGETEIAPNREGQTVVIPESDHIYVNGSSRKFTAEGEISALLRLTVESPGVVHILSSGVNITLVLYDEATDDICGVYASEDGLLDVPFDAAAGTYLLGFSGWGEAEVLAADEENTARIYEEEEAKARENRKSEDDMTEDSEKKDTEETSDDSSEDETADDAAKTPATGATGDTAEAATEETTGESSETAAQETTGESEETAAQETTGESSETATQEIAGEPEGTATQETTGESAETATQETTGEPEETATQEIAGEPEGTATEETTGEPAEAEAEETTGETAKAPAEETGSEPVETVSDVTTDEPAETPNEENTGDGQAPAETAGVSDENITEGTDTVSVYPQIVESADTSEDNREGFSGNEPEETPAEETAEQTEKPGESEKGFFAGFAEWLIGKPSDESTDPNADVLSGESPEENKDEPAEDEAGKTNEEPASETAEKDADETNNGEAEASDDETGDELTGEGADGEISSGDAETTDEDLPDEDLPDEDLPDEDLPDEDLPDEDLADEDLPGDDLLSDDLPEEEQQEEPEEEPFDASVLIGYQAKMNETVSVLAILADAGAPANYITAVAGETEGAMVSVLQNGDWLLTPYTYFDSIELLVKAGDFTAPDFSASEAIYTLIFSNPAPAQENETETAAASTDAEDVEPASEETAGETAEMPAEETDGEKAETSADETGEETADETADGQAYSDDAETTEEDLPEEEQAESEEESFDPSVPIGYQAAMNETISVLAILADAGAPANVITGLSGEMEGLVFSVSQNGDWLLTPYAYFENMELSVTATDYLAEDPSGAEAVYTVVLSNPDPDAEKKPEEPEAVSEEAEETEDALPEKDVTIEMERFEGNEIRLFAKNVDAEENENLVYQWQFSLDNEHWVDVEGANAREYTFKLDDTTSNSYWRLCVSEKASEEEAEGTSEEAAFEDIVDPQPQDS